MTERLRSWLSRGAAIGVLLALLAAGYGLFVHPMAVAYPAAMAELEDTRERLARFRRIAAASGPLKERLDQVRAEQAQSGAFVGGETEGLASASLQERLDRSVRQAGGSVRSVRSLSPEREDGMVRLRLQVQVNADVHALKRLLYELETSRPLLFVESLEVRAQLSRSEDRESLVVTPEFLVDLAVTGYRIGGAS